jgi:hypothetical protein
MDKRNKDKYQKDNLYYDLQCSPQDYLPCMIRMMNEVEKSIKDKLKKVVQKKAKKSVEIVALTNS